VRQLLVILIFLGGFSQQFFAQKVEPKGTFNVDLTLPGSTVNKPFGDIMQGLVNSSVYYQYSFPFHLNIGAGVRYMLFTIDEFAVPNKVYGSLQAGTAFVKLGWDKFHSERFATDLGIKVGYMEGFYSTDLNQVKGQNPMRFNAPAVEGTLGLILTADERNAYRLVLGYGGFGHGFSPQVLGLDSNEDYNVEDYSKASQYFIVGFGYTYYFGQKSASD
jgi:hypothetical protein